MDDTNGVWSGIVKSLLGVLVLLLAFNAATVFGVESGSVLSLTFAAIGGLTGVSIVVFGISEVTKALLGKNGGYY